MVERALIFAPKHIEDLRQKLDQQFDNYELIELEASPHTLYHEANQVIKIVQKHSGPVFLIVDQKQPLFSAILAAKLARFTWTFQAMEWVGNRFRVLKAP